MKSSKPLHKMVYYFTSKNVKMIRDLLLDYGSTITIAPNEYMKLYIEKCPEETEDYKIAWITETFLGIQKHCQFLKDIACNLPEELSDQERDYFMILLYAVIFQIDPSSVQNLYKCFFNLSKPLLNTFIVFLSKNDVLTQISYVAQTYYDINFISEKLICPLHTWQPYMREMAQSYAKYVMKMESQKVKPPTEPIQPNVLNRRRASSANRTARVTSPIPPANSLNPSVKRILSRHTIDEKLKHKYEKNKQKANRLLEEVKNKDCHYAMIKSDAYFQKLANIKKELDYPKTILPKLPNTCKKTCQPVKETAANIKRTNKRIQLAEVDELQWFNNVVDCKNTAKIEELREFDRQENERERLLDIEKKHLKGQISYEEALLAKQRVVAENKKKYEEVFKEKEMWNKEIEKWREEEMKKNRKQIEKLSIIELSVLEAKHAMVTKNKETANNIKLQNQILLEKALKAKQDELDQKIKMIKELKILANISNKSKLPKIIDLTETSGLGLLCEMSIAELQERINAMKISLNEEVERRRHMIKEIKEKEKEKLEESKKSIESYLSDRATTRRKQNVPIRNENASSKEIDDLKKILDEKRTLRMKMAK